MAGVGSTIGFTEPCDFVFDEQVAWWPNLRKVAATYCKTDLTRSIGATPTYGDEKTVLPLQAADLYAWQLRRNFSENKVIFMPTRRPLRQLEPILEIGHHYEEDEVMPVSRDCQGFHS